MTPSLPYDRRRRRKPSGRQALLALALGALMWALAALALLGQGPFDSPPVPKAPVVDPL